MNCKAGVRSICFFYKSKLSIINVWHHVGLMASVAPCSDHGIALAGSSKRTTSLIALSVIGARKVFRDGLNGDYEGFCAV